MQAPRDEVLIAQDINESRNQQFATSLLLSLEHLPHIPILGFWIGIEDAAEYWDNNHGDQE